MLKNEKIDLAVLLLTSLLLSTYLFFRTYVISLDGAFQFIPMAKMFASGSLRDAINFGGQQPLYSFFISLLSRWVPNFEMAGKLVSAFFGTLVIFPVYYLGKRIFDQKIAFLSTFLLVMHPYFRRFSADVLKDSTYLFFFASAIWFSWRALDSEKKYPHLLIPVFSAMAYLVRPDGIEVLFVVLFYLLFIKQFVPSKRRWIPIFFIMLSTGLLFSPYLLHLRETAGEWALGKTKTLGMILGWEETGGDIPLYERVLYSLKELNLEIIGTFHPLYLLLLIFGLWKKKRGLGLKTGEKFLISLGALHYVILFLLILNFTEWKRDEMVVGAYFSGRHVLPLLIVTIYWVGQGVLEVHSWVSERKGLHFGRERRSLVVWSILIILLFGLVLPKTLKPQRYERLTEKWAGFWIKDRSGEGSTIFTSVRRVAYYTETNYEYVDLKKDSLDKIKAAMTEKDALYLIVGGEDAFLPSGYFNQITSFGGKGLKTVIIYERVE
jgi:hypothetical protein